MSDEVVGEGRFLRLRKRGRWEYVERVNATGVVAIVALTDDREIILVEQERPPVGRRVIEIPAGLAGDVDGEDSFLEAARRELLEETGFQADHWTHLGDLPTSAGLTTEVLSVYRATGLHRTGPGGGDGSEEIAVHVVPLDDADAWLERKVDEGALVDAKLYAGLYFAHAG